MSVSEYTYSEPKSYLVVVPAPAPAFENDFDNVLELIEYCAKVSNPTKQMQLSEGGKLLDYLIAHKHWSPFEMASTTIGLETTRDIARQVLRHRSFSFQEFSQRYADPNDMEKSFVLREARLQDPVNRQNSIECTDAELQREWALKQIDVINAARAAYDWAIDNNIAKEQARCVLPEGNTVSHVYMNGTIRSWIHFLELRTGNGTQKEHILLARNIAKSISTIFPMAKDFSDG